MGLDVLDWQAWLPVVFSSQGSAWVMLFVALIVFFESSCILTPFLPGDSLLVTVGLMFSKHHLSIIPFALLIYAVTCVGYQINMISAGWVEAWIKKRFPGFVLRHKERIHKVRLVFHRHGMMFLLFARFSPIVRTYLPFCCGIAKVNQRRFLQYNLLGGFIWVGLLLCLPYSLGHIDWVSEHAHWIIMSVVIFSLMPFIGIMGKMLYQSLNQHQFDTRS